MRELNKEEREKAFKLKVNEAKIKKLPRKLKKKVKAVLKDYEVSLLKGEPSKIFWLYIYYTNKNFNQYLIDKIINNK